MTENLSADLERDREIGGEAPAETERRRMAIGDWRMVNGERQVVNGE